MKHLRAEISLVLLFVVLMPTAFAADLLPAETRFVAASTAPLATIKEFDIATAQDLVVTLTDFGSPAALASASIVVTQADAISGSASLAPPATTATLSLPGAVGHYTVRVFGAPDAAFSVGTFGVCVAPESNPSACIQSASLSGNISAQGSVSDPTISTPSIPLTVTADGNYTFTYTDLQFPTALNGAPRLALFQQGVAAPVLTDFPSGQIVNLVRGKYTLLLILQADQTSKAGLFGLTIAGDPGTTPLYDDTLVVGTIAPPVIPNNPAAQPLTLTVTDYAFPAALPDARALVTFGGATLGTTSSIGGPVSFAAPASTTSTFIKVWTYAAPGATAGTFNVDLSAGANNLLSSAFGVGSSTNQAYAFVTTPLAAGSFRATASDFEFPSTLQSLKFAVAQNGVILQQSATAGAVDFTAASGPVVLLVAAQSPANGNGLFGLNVQSTGASPQVVFDKAQGVSPTGLFDSQDIVVGTSGDFDVTLSDLKFPAQFQDLALVVSRGGIVLGKIFGGGTFSFSATPGTLQLTFIATPAAQQQYGLYSVKVVTSAPTVTLAATPTSLVAGESTTLNWTTSGADSCIASGGNWTGSKAVNTGSEVVKVDATTTFTLTCTGTGGSTAKTVSITASPKPASSRGGGGSMDLTLLLLLAVLVILNAGSLKQGRAS